MCTLILSRGEIMKLLMLCLFGLIVMTIPCETIRAQAPVTPADLQKLAGDYYNWRNQNYPVSSSDAGLHTWDSKLTDYGLAPLPPRRLPVQEVPAKLTSLSTGKVG